MASLSVFKWAFLREKKNERRGGGAGGAGVAATGRPHNTNEARWGPPMNTWKSPPLLHTKVDQVSVEPAAGFYLFIYLFLLNASEIQTQELEERPRDDSPKK